MTLFFPQLSLLPLERYAVFIGPQRMQEVALRVTDLRAQLSGRVVWNVSSTYAGGGVAEMVRSLLAYARGSDVDARWVVIQGTPEFFRVTKRLHNAIHGSEGDNSPLGDGERRIYERVAAESARELAPLVRSRDIVIIHDPQPAAMLAELARRGAHVVWRCHIGSDETNAQTELGWRFLAPYLQEAAAYVFSRASYLPGVLEANRAVIIPPSLDPFSAKNQPMSEGTVRAILAHVGIIGAQGVADAPTYLREDGTPARVDRYADVLRMGTPPPWETPLVVQVSRWDRLKDAVGVMRGFVRAGSDAVARAHLVLAGPSTRAVADDPEDSIVYAAVVDAWRALPGEQRARIHLVSMPTVDVEENAALVNALQRHATVVVQKSICEGFGLTVTEAMWKSRPVIASAVGGIRDQIEDGEQGLLLRDPADLAAFAQVLERLMGNPDLLHRLGANGRTRVLERYLGVDSLLRYGALIEALDARRVPARLATADFALPKDRKWRKEGA